MKLTRQKIAIRRSDELAVIDALVTESGEWAIHRGDQDIWAVTHVRSGMAVPHGGPRYCRRVLAALECGSLMFCDLWSANSAQLRSSRENRFTIPREGGAMTEERQRRRNERIMRASNLLDQARAMLQNGDVRATAWQLYAVLDVLGDIARRDAQENTDATRGAK